MMEESQPLRGRTIAFETRYDVSTQVLSSWPAERLPAICGRATLAMEVSSTSMNVASVTVIAMIHGLIAGRQMSAFSSGGAAALTGESRPWAQPTRRGEAIDHYLRRDRELSSPERVELPSHNSRSHFPVATG